MKILDPTSFLNDNLDLLAPHPYRGLIAFGTFFSSFALGILFVAAGNVYEHLMSDYEREYDDPRERLGSK
ncbi:hypothetical protein [Jeotgalibacillus soli]|uniref:hypothetical protein n=1 Tax=Jeotgalibacillus soli TaxID=889306 RepID=UPI001F1CC1EB|nr:hypothetical protein [Jeotgalibacillus soli]